MRCATPQHVGTSPPRANNVATTETEKGNEPRSNLAGQLCCMPKMATVPHMRTNAHPRDTATYQTAVTASAGPTRCKARNADDGEITACAIADRPLRGRLLSKEGHKLRGEARRRSIGTLHGAGHLCRRWQVRREPVRRKLRLAARQKHPPVDTTNNKDGIVCRTPAVVQLLGA